MIAAAGVALPIPSQIQSHLPCDLKRGVIVTFNEYRDDKGLTREEALTRRPARLESWCNAWLNTIERMPGTDRSQQAPKMPQP